MKHSVGNCMTSFSSKMHNPTDPFKILELLSPSFDVSEQHKIYQSSDSEMVGRETNVKLIL